MFVFLHLLPHRQDLAIVVTALSHGPLGTWTGSPLTEPLPPAWAIVVWKNKMAFHSVDSITSLFIHLDPPLTLYTLFWKHHDVQYISITELLAHPPPFSRVMKLGVAAYLLWQLMYYIFVIVLRADKIQSGYTTSHTWMISRANRRSFLYKLVDSFGPRGQVYVFMLLQLCYSTVTLIPTFLVFRWHTLHAVMMVFFLSASIYNGATYYFHIFSHRYLKDLQKLKEGLADSLRDLPPSNSPPMTPTGVTRGDAASDFSLLADGRATDGAAVSRTSASTHH